jgi:hypothetical protein
VRLADPVTRRWTDATVDEVLKSLFAGRGLAHVVIQDQLWVTLSAARRGALETVRYNVSDLAPSDAQAKSLADLLRRLVAPESWKPAGGKGTVESSGGALLVGQNALVHAHVLSFCEKLRTARGLRGDHGAEERFGLATRVERARPKLRQSVTLNYDAAPLAEIVADLAKISEATIAVNWLSLAAEGVHPQVQAKLKVQDRALGEALGELMTPLRLGCRIAGPETFEIVSRKLLDTRLELEFYPVRDLVPNVLAAPALVETLENQVGGGSWSDAGGPAVIEFDPPSGCLIVLQSQPLQIALGRALDNVRSKRGK